MKKILFLVPIFVLLAASCGKSATTAPVSQNSSAQTPQGQQAAAQAPTPTGTPVSSGAAAGQLTTVNVPLPTALYAATDDGFSINFPSTPKITDSTFKSPTAGTVPVTEYRQAYSGNSENAYYTIYVYHYPASYQFASDYLDTAFQTFYKAVNADFPGSEISSKQTTQLLGQPALSGLITIPLKLNSTSTVNTGDYVLVTTKNSNAYIISSYGIAQSNYAAFLNSFKFTE